MQGYSSESQRSASAPTWGSQEAKCQLPVSLRVAMERAKVSEVRPSREIRSLARMIALEARLCVA